MMSHYGASKAAVITLTRELGTAWGRQGIRVNCIAPGPVETEGYLDVLKQAGPDGKKTYDRVAARVGMGRWGKVEEIAWPCVFLASDASSWMTGETIVIDGGPSPREMDEGRLDARQVLGYYQPSRRRAVTVAQLVRALACGAGGCGFDSHRSPHSEQEFVAGARSSVG